MQAASLDTGERISHIVLMGMGEPLDNYENVLRFLELVTAPEGLNLGMRHISLSTCGLVDKIYDLADRKLQLTLSISLHAPNDEIRFPNHAGEQAVEHGGAFAGLQVLLLPDRAAHLF